MMKRLRKLFSLPFLPLTLAPLALFAPMLVGVRAMFWGTPLLQFVPWWTWAWRTLLSGHLPLWNPLVGMGAPLLANYQAGLFYPPYWSYLVFYLLGGVAALAWAQALLVLLHLIWAGVGMARLAERLGLGLLAQTVAGLAFSASGYLVARAGFLSINAAVSWLPWILLALLPLNVQESGAERRGRRWSSFAGLTACLALQLLAGHAQTTWYTLLLGGLWTGFWGLYTSYSRENALHPALRAMLAAWLRMALALGLALGLAAVQLLPTAEYLMQSQRSSAVDYELAMTYSFWPWRLVTLLAPGFFGSPAQGDYWGYANFWEDAIYVGLLPFLLALGAWLRGIRRKSNAPAYWALRWFLVALFALALLWALGKNTPVFPWLYKNVPTFSLFQAPTRVMIWAVFALALLAALGAQTWRRPEGRGLYWTRLGTAGAFAVSLGSGLAWYFMGDISPSFIRATALAGFFGVGAGLLSLVAPPADQQTESGETLVTDLESRSNRLWRWGVALFVALDLAVAGWGLNPAVDLDLYSRMGAVKVWGALAGKRLFIFNAEEYALKYQRFLRFSSFDAGEDWGNLRSVLLTNINMLDKIASANNFDPLVPGRYASWLDFVGGLPPQMAGAHLRLMDVGLVERLDPHTPLGVRFDPVSSSARLHWLPCARAIPDAAAALERVTNWGVDYAAEVIVEAPSPLPGPECASAAVARRENAATLELLDQTPNSLTIQVETQEAGWLLLADTWYPGWNAWVDGNKVDILPADLAFRALPLQSGEHTVVFRYQPLSFWLGLAITLIALVGAVYLWRQRKID